MNVMLDFETWGTAPGSAFRSIGACVFDPYGTATTDEFYLNIDEASCLAAGLTKDPSTVKWWSQQSKEAQEALLLDPVPIREVAVAFNGWFKKQRAVFVWGQGAGFDPVLWECAMRAIGLETPWKFWDVRDTRTAYDMGQFNTRSIKRQGVYHNALDDAKHQSRCVQAAYRRVQIVKPQ